MKTVGMKPKHNIPLQNDDYSRQAEFSFTLPQQFLLLCRLTDITPRQMLVDFMDTLSCGSWKREGREVARGKLIDYFQEQGYGSNHYTPEEIKTIFKELDAIGSLYPFNASQELINEHTRWRKNYHTWWFKKWFEKNNREL